MHIEKFIENLQPFDVLLFHGTGIVSTVIRKVEQMTLDQGEFSHIGVVVDSTLLPNIPQLKPGRKYILDSNLVIPLLTDGVPDVRTKKVRFGVQLRDFRDVLEAFYSKSSSNYISWCRNLANPWLDPKKRRGLILRMDNFIREFGYRPYELNIFQLLGSVCQCSRKISIELEESIVDGYRVLSLFGFGEEKTPEEIQAGSVFCSEFAVMLFQAVGILPKTLRPSNVAPIHFLHPNGLFDSFLASPVRIRFAPNKER